MQLYGSTPITCPAIFGLSKLIQGHGEEQPNFILYSQLALLAGYGLSTDEKWANVYGSQSWHTGDFKVVDHSVSP